MKTIVKATSKGQITLPAKWRKNFNTDRFVLELKDGSLEVRPFDLEQATRGEYTVFDAIRDNKGKGIKAKDLARALKKIQ